MGGRSDQLTDLLAKVRFPVTREELVNQLLVSNAPVSLVSVLERLPADTYQSQDDLKRDVDEISTLDAQEVGNARSYEDLLAIVRRNVGDVDRVSKALYDRVVDAVIEGARQQGNLSNSEIRGMHDRLLASYAELRKPMSETYNYEAPRNPNLDLPGGSSDR
jgi:hypothetical protein